MMLICSLAIRIMRSLCSFKQSKVSCFSIDANTCLPFATSFIPANAFEARCVGPCFASVEAILLWRCDSQIFAPIVEAIQINMIDMNVICSANDLSVH